MKRILPYLLALLMPLSIAACMQQGGTQSPSDAQQGTVANQLFTQVEPENTQTPSNNTATPADEAKTDDATKTVNDSKDGKTLTVKENGTYTDKERVALYIHTYGHLPDNYITKAEAQKLGWDNTQGNLKKVAPGKSIGGDYFGNYEEQLPKAKKRKYYECDIDYKSGKRNAKRIIFSNDGLIFYTGDHYKTFQQLY